MEKENTLADMLLRETFRKKQTITLTSGLQPDALRNDLIRARRFVLDESMSAFMADLSMAPFACAHERRAEVLDALRHGARLPHQTMWLEFWGKPFRQRMLDGYPDAKDVRQDKLASPDEVPVRWGWLFKEEGTSVRFIEVVDGVNDDGSVLVAPFSWCWNTDDAPVPWANVSREDGMFGHGITGYVTETMGVITHVKTRKDHLIDVHWGQRRWMTHKLIVELTGTMRYAMAFLATLNDVPVLKHDVIASKGFVARGSYRKYLNHTIIRLNIPEKKDQRTLAKKYIGAARRRCHQVRGHWRVLHRGDPALMCQPSDHRWGAPIVTTDDDGKIHQRARCAACNVSWRTWIHEHQRGDDKLGFVTHDYAVSHESVH